MRLHPFSTDLGRSARRFLLAFSVALGFSAGAFAQVPGPEIFDKEPTTPIELWEAADYLVRTDQSVKAAPYLKTFVEGEPDDDSLIQIRDKYGFGSALRLQDHPATRAFAEPIIAKIIAAARRHDTDPDRLAGYVKMLTKTPSEQVLAAQGLRAGGPAAVPTILKALQDPSLEEADRASIIRNLGKLGTPAVPPLLAAVESPDADLAAAAARAIGQIGDRRAVPLLTAMVFAGPADVKVKTAAARAIESITGRPFQSQPKPPARLLADEARRYQAHQMKFPGDPVTLWSWDADASVPAPRTVSRDDAEAEFGGKLAAAALAVDPNDATAKAVSVGLRLNQAIAKAGIDKFPAEDPKALEDATAAGPEILHEVLRQAIADGNDDLGAVTAAAVGHGLTAEAVQAARPFHPLVQALDAPGRRTRFAAAKVLASLDLDRAFPGSSKVVPTLSHFLNARGVPRAVVIDGNPSRGNTLAGYLRALGYDASAAASGPEGFRDASSAADVELVMVHQHMIQGDWKLQDVLANLLADARTAGIPVYVVGPQSLEYDLPTLTERFPGARRVVSPVGPTILNGQLELAGRPEAFPVAEKAALAKEAAELLAGIAVKPRSPHASDLLAVEPSLTRALRQPETSTASATALGETPVLNAQRGLADVLTDPASPPAKRAEAGSKLVRSIGRFGALLTGEQEARLINTFNLDADPSVRSAVAEVIQALQARGD